MERNYTSMQRNTCSRVFPHAKPLGVIPANTIIGPIQDVHMVEILNEYGIEIAIPSFCKPRDVTYVVISRETERFVNEIHTHEARIRSSWNSSKILKSAKKACLTNKER